MNDLSQRDLRQRDIVPPAALAGCSATVIGVGAVGRQVALQLAALGLPRLHLIDFDVVEAVNLAPQGYLEEDLGQPKVAATAALIRRIHSGIAVELVPERFRRSMHVGDVVFCCVDQIATRTHIWQALGTRCRYLGDARMSAEVVRVLSVYDAASHAHYPATLFAPEQAFTGTCTAKSTVFTANLAAGLLLASFSQFLRGLRPEPDVTVNLLAWELTVARPAASAERSIA